MLSRTLFTVFFFAILVGCGENKEVNMNTSLSEQDSLRLMSRLLDSIRAEYHAQEYFHTDWQKVNRMGPAMRNPNNLNVNIDSNSIRINTKNCNATIINCVLNYFRFNLENGEDQEANVYPKYNFVCRNKVIEEIRELDKLIAEIKTKSEEAAAFLNLRRNHLKHRLKTLNTLNRECYKYPSEYAMVDVDYTSKNKAYHASLDSIFIAYYHLRDSSSKKYFKTPYLQIFRESLADTSTKAKDQIDALKMLYPISVMDMPFARSNRIIPPRIPAPPVVEFDEK
jgi:hypothetical protein